MRRPGFCGTSTTRAATSWRTGARLDGKEWLVLADGRTGKVIKQVPWPAPALPHVDNNYRMAVAKFHKESTGPDTLLVFTDTGGTITLAAYDKDLNKLWRAHGASRQGLLRPLHLSVRCEWRWGR